LTRRARGDVATARVQNATIPFVELRANGIDVWYVDESSDAKHFAVSAFSVPFLRPRDTTASSVTAEWDLVWDLEFKKVQAFRKLMRQRHTIPVRKELHAVDLVSGRGNYRQGKHRFGKKAAAGVYRWLLWASLAFCRTPALSLSSGTRAQICTVIRS
jgi:hypothetical protein